MADDKKGIRHLTHTVDFCVVGGGMAGITTAIAAARQGIKVAIMQDRPIFGGNASSEIRVHICGADRHNQFKNLRETGILEELRMENLRRNPQRSFSVWDTILYEKIRCEQNIKYFLNCSCLDAKTSHSRIKSVTGWQLTTYTYHTIKAKLFADCSGDGILAPLVGAKYQVGREARSKYNESIEPIKADKKTMGMTCLFQARNAGRPVEFEPLPWAYVFPTEEDLPKNFHGWPHMGYWWIELGGEDDSIHDTERLRDELLRITYGVWDHMKNFGDHGADNWELEWIQFLPGKRESRRYVGAYVVNQNDIEAGGQFDDTVAYGGWSMDDHDTKGFWAFKHDKPSTIFHKAPSPYGIPYRCLYSKNIENLFFAGRCASCSHAAMSSTRVMGTGMVMGQAVGTAAALCIENRLTPVEIGQGRIWELQALLQYQDCYLPGVPQRYHGLTADATLSATNGNTDHLRDGINRPVGNDQHCWEGKIGDSIEYNWEKMLRVSEVTLIINSALDKNVAMSYHQPDDQLTAIPEEMIKGVRIEVKIDKGWELFVDVKDNYQRLVRIPIGHRVCGVRATFLSTWGAKKVRVYAFYLT
jgi:hypothetical protein